MFLDMDYIKYILSKFEKGFGTYRCNYVKFCGTCESNINYLP